MLQQEGQPSVQIVEVHGRSSVQVVDPEEKPLLDLQPTEALDFAVRLVNAAADALSGERYLVVTGGAARRA